MSLIRIAVEVRLSDGNRDIRELLRAAYMRRYGKDMPPESLEEDAKRWEAGENNIAYLYDFILQTCSA